MENSEHRENVNTTTSDTHRQSYTSPLYQIHAQNEIYAQLSLNVASDSVCVVWLNVHKEQHKDCAKRTFLTGKLSTEMQRLSGADRRGICVVFCHSWACQL